MVHIGRFTEGLPEPGKIEERNERTFADWEVDLKRESEKFTEIRKDPLKLKYYIQGWQETKVLNDIEADRYIENIPEFITLDKVESDNSGRKTLTLWHQGIVEKVFRDKDTLGPLVLPPHGYRNIEAILGKNPNPDISEKILILQPRKTLKTLSVAIATFLFIMKYPLNPEVMILSFSKDQAAELIKYLDKAFAECKFKPFCEIRDKFLKPSTDWYNNRIVFEGLSGRKAIFSKNAYNKTVAKTIRSSHVELILVDEADQLKYTIIQDLEGNLNLGQKMVCLTTPAFEGSWTQLWYQAYVHKHAPYLKERDPYTRRLMEGYVPKERGYENIKVLRTTIGEVLDVPGRSKLRFYTRKQVEDLEAIAIDQGTYAKYLADIRVEWSTGDNGPMFRNGLDNNFKNFIPPHPLYSTGGLMRNYYFLLMGVDVGLVKDFTVFTIFGLTRNANGDEEIHCINIDFLHNTKGIVDPEMPDKVVDKIISLGMLFGCFTAVIDENGTSSPVYYNWIRRVHDGDSRLTPFEVIEGKWGKSPTKKYEAFTKLFSVLSRQKLFFPSPRYLRELQLPESESRYYYNLAEQIDIANQQVKSMTYYSTPAGGTKLKGNLEHDDYACSIAFAMSEVDNVTFARSAIEHVHFGRDSDPLKAPPQDEISPDLKKNAEHIKRLVNSKDPEKRERYAHLADRVRGAVKRRPAFRKR